ncbi:MAG: alkaline phosphatase family protein [Candidatus Izemoplasmatales bacterium]
MYPIVFPNYQNSIMNVTASILRHYGVKTEIVGNPLLDQFLKKKHRNIVYILVDALGANMLDQHDILSVQLNKDRIGNITSVFPPTTVAATTSVLTGRPPIETGWLGWCQYVREVDKSVIFFLNKDYYSEKSFDENLSDVVAPVTKIYELIEEAKPSVKTTEIFPAFREPRHDTFQKQCESIVALCDEPGEHFMYCYWDKLDTLMHEGGLSSPDVKAMLAEIDKAYKFLVDHVADDTLIVLLADHGQVDVCPIELRRYPDLWETFRHEPSVESRAAAFFIQEEKKEKFVELFNKYFRQYFILLPREEVLQMNLFGYGVKHPRLDEFLGDYMAIAIDHYYFKMSTDSFFMKGQHAGLLEGEMMVPLIVHSKKNNK